MTVQVERSIRSRTQIDAQIETSPHPKMEPLIFSDAVAETFSKGVAIKLSDCSPKFQLYFSDAREVNLYGKPRYSYAQTSHVNDIYIIY